MTKERSFFDNLMHRRVPQIVGMYIAASWLVIELGDWVTERFNLPTEVTSYVFVAMLVMLPAVVLFAYNHGAPGRDEWTRGERVFIPLNALATLLVLYAMGPQLEVEAATVRELLRLLLERYPEMERHYDEGVAVYINGEIYRDIRDLSIPSDAEVFLLPRLQGG